jgi:hypothetical protein
MTKKIRNRKNKKTQMKNTIIAIVVALAAFISPSFAGTPVYTPTPTVVESQPLNATFKLFGASVIEDSDAYLLGGGVSLEVPVFQNLKLEVVGSVFEDSLYTVGGNFLYYIPVTEAFSVYAIGGGGYEFETDQWTVGAGAGVKYALSQQLSLFADGIYNWTVEDNAEDGVTTVRVGVGFSF